MAILTLLAVKKMYESGAERIAATPSWVKVLLALAVTALATSLYTTHVVSAKYKAEIKEIHASQERLNKRVEKAYLAAAEESDRLSDIVFADMHEQLMEANARKDKVRIIVKEVNRYVTEKSDATVVIPRGFVWLHNASLAGQNPAVAESEPGDVDAPSGVKLSDVAAVTASNNAECVYRGEVITLWQEWYHRQKVIHDDAQAHIDKAVQAQ